MNKLPILLEISVVILIIGTFLAILIFNIYIKCNYCPRYDKITYNLDGYNFTVSLIHSV